MPDFFWGTQEKYRPNIDINSRLPALKKLIARAHQQPAAEKNHDRQLFELFNIKISDQDDVPLAAVLRLVDKPVQSDQYYIFADPVHLRADRDSIIMLGNEALNIKSDETNQLIDLINSHFHADGIRIESIAGHHWCLSVPNIQKLRTYPLIDVIGRNIHDYLPYGEDSRYWRSIFNEVQMLLSSCDVNREREARSELAINSLWFWGGGALPASIKSSWTTVCGNNMVLQGLARYADAGFEKIPDNAFSWYKRAGMGEHLVDMENAFLPAQGSDFDGWHEKIAEMESKWFLPLLGLLKSNQLASLTVHLDAARCYHLTPTLARRWWMDIVHYINHIKDIFNNKLNNISNV